MQYPINSFFAKDVYDTEIRLDVNEDVLKRIYADGTTSANKLAVEFVFITDTEERAKKLEYYLSSHYNTYNNLDVAETEDYWEVRGITDPIKMEIARINQWNKAMSDIGYNYDCQLDGWQVGV